MSFAQTAVYWRSEDLRSQLDNTMPFPPFREGLAGAKAQAGHLASLSDSELQLRDSAGLNRSSPISRHASERLAYLHLGSIQLRGL
jgi:hypothetical protein